MKVFYVSLMHCLLQNVLARVKSIIVSETFLKHLFGAIDFNTPDILFLFYFFAIFRRASIIYLVRETNKT